jgi:hypothetical protein
MLQTGISRVRFPIRSLNFFMLPNLSSRTITLEFTQPLTEISTRKFPGEGVGKVRPSRKADNLTAISQPIV